ncbi:MAG: hypothetical protein KKH01_04195 [Firmicutes bacterium]|nr:hypothetical protein [Bacillota bacterium]
MILFVYSSEQIVEQRLYRAYNQLYYEQTMSNLIIIIYPFLIVLLMMDHDQAHLKPMISYFGRTYIALIKLFFYVLVLTWFFCLFFMIYHIIPFYLTAYYTYKASSIFLFLNLYLDGLMLALMILILIKDKHKHFAILIALFYILSNWLIEDQQNIYLFYLFPQFSSFFSTITLAYIYKMCYICLGLTIYAYQINFEAL